MKCQHCGINFDDSERVCPICGARAGSRGRLSKPTGGFFHTQTHASNKNTQKTIINGKVKKSLPQEKGKMIAIIAVVAAVIIQVIPGLISSLISSMDYGATADVQNLGPAASVAPDYDYMTLHDIIGDQAVATLPDGENLYLFANEEGEYALKVEGDWRFYETGYVDVQAWDRYTYGEELTYAEVLPEDEYTDYEIWFQEYSLEQSGEIRDLDAHAQNGGMCLVAHVSNQGDEVILNNYYGDAEFLFGDEQFIFAIPLAEDMTDGAENV